MIRIKFVFCKKKGHYESVGSGFSFRPYISAVGTFLVSPRYETMASRHVCRSTCHSYIRDLSGCVSILFLVLRRGRPYYPVMIRNEFVKRIGPEADFDQHVLGLGGNDALY